MKKLAQSLVLAFLALGFALGPVRADTATSCTAQTQTTVLSYFSDNAGPGTIVPSMLRNFVCSVLVAQTNAQAPVPVTLTALSTIYSAPSAGTLFVYGGKIEITRDGGVTWYLVSLTGGQVPLSIRMGVRITLNTLPDGVVVPMPVFLPAMNTIP